MTRRHILAFVLAALGGACVSEQPAGAADSAVILMYHHVDSETPPSTSITPERFSAQLDYLERENFRVRPLLEVLEALQSGNAIADKTVVLTFDDGYESVLENAMPLLRSRGWPFTVFVTTNYADQNYGGYLNWEQIRRLAANGATIGNHTRTHAHLVRRLPGESEREWQQRVRAEIADAGQRLASEVGTAAIPALAYPYGEYDATVRATARDLGLFSLGQHSGAAGSQSDLFALPRFPVASGYDSLEDFSLRVHSRTLPARVVGRERHVLDADDLRPALRLELAPGDFRAAELACYATAQGAIDLTWNPENPEEVVARPREPLGAGRTKYNCTAPSASESGVYYWFSYLWMKKNADGSWYTE